MAAIYNCDVYCDECADDIRYSIAKELFDNGGCACLPDGTVGSVFEDVDDLDDYLRGMDETLYDSCDYPKYYQDYSEADCQQHCEDCGDFLENALTSDGVDYVRELAIADCACGDADGAGLCYLDYYDYIELPSNCGECSECGELTDVLEDDLCPDCAEQAIWDC